MNRTSKIYVAGHTGLVGSALMRALWAAGFYNIVTRPYDALDLRNQAAVEKFFARERPEYVFLAAAKVGGIAANAAFPVDFLYDNLMIQTHVMSAAHKYQVKKLLFLGSSCIYPRLAEQPIQENCLLTGPLEPTNEAYAIAKIAGVKLCEAYRKQHGLTFMVAMPTNLYGPGDNFDKQSSHVLPALIAKFSDAHEKNLPEVVVWGTGSVRREFLFVDDLAQALIFLMQHYTGSEPINIGTGSDISIAELAALVKELVGYTGNIVFDTSQPEGTPRKLLDVSRIHALGWKATTPLREGILRTMVWYREDVGLTCMDKS
jgi:GDP-L-fucose synthase